MTEETKKHGLIMRLTDAGVLIVLGGLLFNAGMQYQRLNEVEQQVGVNTKVAHNVQKQIPVNLSQVPSRLAAIETQLEEVNSRLNYLTRRIDKNQ